MNKNNAWLSHIETNTNFIEKMDELTRVASKISQNVVKVSHFNQEWLTAVNSALKRCTLMNEIPFNLQNQAVNLLRHVL